MLISDPKKKDKCKAVSPFHTTKDLEIKLIKDPIP